MFTFSLSVEPTDELTLNFSGNKQAMRRILLPLAVVALAVFPGCDILDGPGGGGNNNNGDITNVEGGWIRIASNNPSSDGIIIDMQGGNGTIKDKAGSNFQNGDIKWKDIEAVDGENYIYEELGSDYNYYAATMILRSDDTLRISIASSGAGNEQKWVREGTYTPVAQAEVLTGGISTATKLENGPADIDYCIEGVLDVTAPLEIEPGTVIAIGENGGIGVYDAGSIKAIGTSAEPIVIKGKGAAQGYWRGIHIETNSLNNRFEFVEISDAGSNYVYCCNEAASVFLKDGKLAVENSTLSNGGAYGIVVRSNAEFSGFANNTITTHEDAPMLMHLKHADYLDGETSDFSGNDKDYLEIVDGNVTEPTTAPKNNVPYRVGNGIVINITEELTLNPGVEIQMEENSGLGVFDQGSLTINGTSTQPVVIKGTDLLRGYWRGIHIETNSSKNKFTYAEISNAGSNYVYCCNTISTVFLKGGKLNIQNSTLSEGDGYGLYADKDANLEGYANNTITTHNQSPVYLDAKRAGELDGASSYPGNVSDYVRIFDSQVSVASTWKKQSVPYLVEGVVDVTQGLTIETGAEVAFTENSGMGVYDNGFLNAIGTAGNEIIFRGFEETASYWRGIHVETNSSANELTHVELKNAGTNYVYCCNEAANLFLKSGQMTVTNSTITGSGGCGIQVRPAATLTESGNTFSGNANGHICN